MYLDLKFFKNLIKMLETDHNMVRTRDDVTEAWKFHVDQTIMQCKEMILSAENRQDRENILAQYNELVSQLESIGWYPILKSDTYIEFEEDEEQNEQAGDS